MHDQLRTPGAEQAEQVAMATAARLCELSVRPPYNPAAVKDAIKTSLSENLPLCLRMVLCPNWAVENGARVISPIPVEAAGNQLIIAEPNLNIIGLLSEEIPLLVGYLNKQGMRVELLVILADILSSGWVHDSKKAKEALVQNQKAVGLLLNSSPMGKEVFNDPSRAVVKVRSQLELATNTPGYETRLNEYQMSALTHNSRLYQWYLSVIGQLQTMGEYADKRTDVAGMRKIWERALFLAAIYALDGQVMKTDFATAGFPPHNCAPVAIGTVSSAHGDIIARGWNLLTEKPIGVITPLNNAMGHGWSEPRKPAVSYEGNQK